MADSDTTPSIAIHWPAPSEDRISDDLCDLTEALGLAGVELAGGFLGGQFGYGAEYENEVFTMHPFCWCECFECPWCLPCECPDSAVRYFDVAGTEVDASRFFDLGGYRTGKSIDVPENQCSNCRSGKDRAANFFHKPSGSTIHWYKYIGRSMEVDLHEKWDTIIVDVKASLGGVA